MTKGGAKNDMPSGMCVLHRASFIEWQPSTIACLASSADGSLAVAARENGDLELYDTTNLQRVQRIPGHVDAAPTCLAIVETSHASRIFSAGLDGNITEYDTDSLKIAAISDSYGGAVWQLAVEPLSKQPANTSEGDDEGNTTTSSLPRIAAACDDGCVRLFALDESSPGLIYNKSLPRVEGRILTTAWHSTGKYIATGGTDGCIRVWEVATNREVFRITAGDGTGKELCIWSLVFLPDGTLVSGDSNGNVSFWEGEFGTLITRFTQHKADVLQVTSSPDGSTVFAAGVDPQITVMKRLQSDPGAQQKWAFLSAKRPHTHDVRALCVVYGRHAPEPLLWSGGNDTMIYSHSVDRFLKEHPRKVDLCPQKPLLQVVPPLISDTTSNNERVSPWLLAAQKNQIDIWQLSTPDEGNLGNANQAADGLVVEGAPIPPIDRPWHLARLTSRSGRHLVTAAASYDGSCIAYSDTNRTMCFAIEATSAADPTNDDDDDDEIIDMNVLPQRLQFIPMSVNSSEIPASTHLTFRPGRPRELIACAADGTIRLLQLPSVDQLDDDEEAENKGGDEKNGVEVLHVLRDIHDLRYKMWYKRDRGRNAARHVAPVIDLIAPSPDGHHLAVAVRGRAFVLSLETGHIVCQASPLADHAPITSLAFTGDSAILAIIGAKNELLAISVPEGKELNVSDALPQRWKDLPGPLVGATAHPGESDALMVYSSEAVCYLDLSKPMNPDQPRGKKRRRAKDVRVATPAGDNCRALYCEDPVLYVEFVGSDALLVVERAWSEVWKGLAAPLYRHRYGT